MTDPTPIGKATNPVLQWLMLVLAGSWPALWLFVPYGLSPEGDRGFGTSMVTDTYRGLLGVFLHVPHARTLEYPAALLATGVFATTVVAIALMRGLIRRLDPVALSWAALRWSMHTLPCMAIWCCGPLVALAAAAIWFPDVAPADWLDGALMALILLCLFAPVVLCLRRDIVSRDRPPAFWIPRWPGGGAFVVTVIFLPLWWLIEAAQKWFEFGPMKAPAWTVVLEELTGWLLGLVLTSALLVAWQRGWGPRRLFSNRASWIHGPRLRTLAALDLRIGGVFALLFLPPILILSSYMIYLAPQIEELMRTYPGPEHDLFHGTVSATRFVVSYWWLSGGELSWLFWAPAARASHLVDVAEGSVNG